MQVQEEMMTEKEEVSAARAKRSVEQLRLRLKEEMAQGACPDAILYWLLSDETRKA